MKFGKEFKIRLRNLTEMEVFGGVGGDGRKTVTAVGNH